MIKGKVSLVLGAGSSVSFDYPVGGALKKDILNILGPDKNDLAIRAGLHDWSDGSLNIHTFLAEFKKSQRTSIDAFLARRPQFSEIGKLAIEAILLGYEKQDHLSDCDHEDLWQRYFFEKITTEKWEDLDFSNISIVTFNYDRSLEHYLISALQGSYGKNEEEVLEKLRTLEIVHVYGSLGPTMPGDPGYFYYGAPVERETVKAAAQSLKVIPEGRDDDVSLKKAQALLNGADTIGFLGFGFDEINLRRLDASRTCSAEARAGKPAHKTRNIYATCFNMTPAEARAAIGLLGDNVDYYSNKEFPQTFFDCGCYDMLRRTLLLG